MGLILSFTTLTMEGDRNNLGIAPISQRFVGRVSDVSHQLTTLSGDWMLTSVLKGDLGDSQHPLSLNFLCG